MEQLLKYFIAESNKRFDALEEKLSDIQKFKVEMIVSARWVSLIVSAVCGLLTMIVSVWAAKS